MLLPDIKIISGCRKSSIFGVRCVVVELQTQVVLGGDSYVAQGSLCEVLWRERDWWEFSAVVEK